MPMGPLIGYKTIMYLAKYFSFRDVGQFVGYLILLCRQNEIMLHYPMYQLNTHFGFVTWKRNDRLGWNFW